jgi:hypothetical protein
VRRLCCRRLTRISDQSEFTYFGELALYYRQPRSASVKAVEPAFLFVLEASNFDTFSHVVPDFGKRVKMLTAVHDAKMAVATGGSVQGVKEAAAIAAAAAAANAAAAAAGRATADAAAPSDPLHPLAEAPAASLGLDAWVSSLTHTAPMPAQTILPRRQIGRTCVTVTCDVGFVGIRARANANAEGGKRDHALLLRRAAARTMELARTL